VFSYEQIAKRLRGSMAADTARRMRVSYPMQMAIYYKVAATLKLTGDVEGLKFLQNLKPEIESGKLPMPAVIIQLDQHDWAVRNRMTLAEHRYSLDVPSWEQRPRRASAADAEGSLAAAVAASVR
jgi:hypothetical protein